MSVDFKPVGGGSPDSPAVDSRLGAGIAGAVLGGGLGALIWYLIIRFTGYEIGIAAWGVGVLAGVGTRLLARNGSPALGVAAAVCALAAILGGQYFGAKDVVARELAKNFGEAYEERVQFAKQVVAAKDDDELKKLIALDMADEGQTPNPGAVTDEILAEYKEEDLPELRDMASGKLTKEEFIANFQLIFGSQFTGWNLMKETLSLFTLLWLFLGVSSAFKLGARID
jgi:hypothetical protein